MTAPDRAPAIERLSAAWRTPTPLTTSCTCLWVRDLTSDHRPHRRPVPPRHSKGNRMLARTRRAALTLLAILVAYAAALVAGIMVAATPAGAADDVCDITATVDGDTLTVTHLDPYPAPGNVTINGVVYRSGDWAGDGAGNMVIVLDVSGWDQVTITRDIPPAAGLCTITIPVSSELDAPACDHPRWNRWHHRLSDRCGRDCWGDNGRQWGHEARQWAHGLHRGWWR